MIIEGNIVDIGRRRIYPGVIEISDDRIRAIEERRKSVNRWIMPGLIDAHIHIESSMSTPGAFAAAAVSRGTTSVISDPHEIANVLGTEGVKYMMEDAAKVPLKFWFGAPSCVPATSFESAGAVINSSAVDGLLKLDRVKYLAEMMNYPGVIFDDPEVMMKIQAAKAYGKPVDGHSPGLTGDHLKKYISAGISTDHECSTLDEAKEKISYGMKILIREGSAARNLGQLKSLIRSDTGKVMLCSDDLHPEMLMKRHLDKIIASLVNEGYDIFDILTACCLNPVEHYGIDAGTLKPGSPADIVIVGDLDKMDVLETWIDGTKVYDRGRVLFQYSPSAPVNKFNCSPVHECDIAVEGKGRRIRVIEASDGELLTGSALEPAKEGDFIDPDTERDILKIVVKDRYRDKPPAVAFIRGFGLKHGAFAGSVAHDSHNIIAVGASDTDIVSAVNEVIRMKGGLSVAEGDKIYSLSLPVAGILSASPVSETARNYEMLSDIVRSMGCRISSPFMTLSFMALLVIPELKLSDSGLFDGKNFRHVSLFAD